MPDSVGQYLIDRGHDVVRVRDVMAVDTKDPIVAEAAMQDSRVLLSWDKDFNQQKFRKERYKSLSRIAFCCPEPDDKKRISELIDLVEFAFLRAASSPVVLVIASDKVMIRDHPHFAT